MLLLPIRGLWSKECRAWWDKGGLQMGLGRELGWGSGGGFSHQWVCSCGDDGSSTLATLRTTSLLSPNLGLRLNVYWPLRPDCCLCTACSAQWELHSNPSLLLCYWGHGRCWTASVALILSYFLPWSLRYTYHQVPQCTDLSAVFVYWSWNPLLHYICSACCNFKGTDQEVSQVTISLTSLSL